MNKKLNTLKTNQFKRGLLISAAVSTLSGCVTSKKLCHPINYREVPHIEETTLNPKLIKKQSPIDNELLLQEDAFLNELCFSDLYHVNSQDDKTMVWQKMAEYCQQMKLLGQRTAAEFKRMENKTKKDYNVTEYEEASIKNDIWSYRQSDYIKQEINGIKITNQGLPKDTNLNAVRATAQHDAHQFCDTKSLIYSGALANECVAIDKYELGYGVFENPFLTQTNDSNFEERVYGVTRNITDRIINYAVYEYRHSEKNENPSEYEIQLYSTFLQMERALNTYGYQGKDRSAKDPKLLKQSIEELVNILPETMFGDETKRKVLAREIATAYAMEPLVTSLEEKGFEMSKFNPGFTLEQQAEQSKER